MLRLLGLAIVAFISVMFVIVAWPVIVWLFTMWLVVCIATGLLGAGVYLAEKR